jgi:hypothetical protein
MGRLSRGFVLNACITQSGKIHAFEEPLSGAEQNWRYGDVHLIDKVLAKVLLDGIDSAAHANIFTRGGFACELKRGNGTFCHKTDPQAATCTRDPSLQVATRLGSLCLRRKR